MVSRDPSSPTASGEGSSREAELDLKRAIRVAIERLRDAEQTSPETGEVFYQFDYLDMARIIGDLERELF